MGRYGAIDSQLKCRGHAESTRRFLPAALCLLYTKETIRMGTSADAVVIGAGALGLSAALHLAGLGLRNVVVVEQYEPGSQTSPRAAGLFKLIQPDATRTELARLSVHKVLHFEQETGVPLPVVQSGSIMMART